MKNITIKDDYVEKNFINKDKYKKELIYRNYFNKDFFVPKILYNDDNNLFLRFEKIRWERLDKKLYEWKLNDIIKLFERLPKKEGKINETEKILFVKHKIPNIPDCIINSVNENKGFLTHGDFRPQNIFEDNGKYGLIDFENSGYSFQEKDFAYFYMELVYFNKGLSIKFLDYLKEKVDYNRFLFYCLNYNLFSMQNSLSSKSGLESVLKEVLEEAKKIKK